MWNQYQSLLGSLDPATKSALRRSLGIEEILVRQAHNQDPPLNRHEYEEGECQSHPNPLCSQIIKNLKKPELKGYKLQKGNAFYTQYHGPRLQFKSEQSVEVFRVTNKNKGLALDFRIEERFPMGPSVFVLMLTRTTSMQGDYYGLKRMLISQLWQEVFKPSGFAMIFGRARWSSNSAIRNQKNKSRDWRLTEHDSLWRNKNGKKIRVSGLQLLYYRMGFIPLKFFADQFGDEFVALFSEKVEAQLREALGPDEWKDVITHKKQSFGSELSGQTE